MRVLVVDDERDMLKSVRKLLTQAGFECVTANTGAQGIKLMYDFDFDAILCDLFMPEIDGFKIIAEAKNLQPEAPVIIFTAFGTIERAVEAMKKGAYDFIEKPFDGEHLILLLKRAIEHRKLKYKNRKLLNQLEKKNAFENLIGQSEQMQRIFGIITKVAPTNANILITGESGTGKELIARSIHNLSQRAGKIFVPINCGAFPLELFEAELFGYEKGAFTGATTKKMGLLEYANNGTFFMDEVMEMPPQTQVKLLRVLEDGKFRRLGGTKEINVNVRIVAATNKKINEALEKGWIREDFYYRLNVVRIHVPPLRQRKEDIKLLAYHFLKKAAKSSAINISEIDDDVMDIFENYYWPGNVRELKNIIKRCVVLASKEKITLADLPKYMLKNKNRIDFENTNLAQAKKIAIEKLEKDYLIYLLNKHNGNVTQMAPDAGMTRRNLHRILNKHKLNPNDWRKVK